MHTVVEGKSALDGIDRCVHLERETAAAGGDDPHVGAFLAKTMPEEDEPALEIHEYRLVFPVARGVSYAFNLTPEQNTGLGVWTEEMFMQTIRTGRHMGVSRPINPPMPWPAYRNATDDDLKAIYVPEYQPPADSN